jgi:hypothetical protein
MEDRYMQFNQNNTRMHQAKIDITESGENNKDTKATKLNPHYEHSMSAIYNKHAVYSVVDPSSARTIPQQRRMSKFTLQHNLHAKPMSTHHFGKLTTYGCLSNINHMKVRRLFKIKNLAGYPAHRISDERIAWVCGWIFGKYFEHEGDKKAQQNAFAFLYKVWTSPAFCTFFSSEESKELLRGDDVLWMFRLSTTFPHIVRITTKNSNDVVNPEQALTIHQKMSSTPNLYWWELREFHLQQSPTTSGPD